MDATSTTPFSVYLHIPFCEKKCPYCDFNTYAVPRVPEASYVAALTAELTAYLTSPTWRGRTVRTIFFGGGTPSLLSSAAVTQILTTIKTHNELAPFAEISLEANPGTVSDALLAGYRDAGVNRLSFGVQTLSDKLLTTLGRTHNRADVPAALMMARAVGITNLSIDLMFGVPGQTLADVKADVTAVREFGLEHCSTYGLTIEKGTPYYVSLERGTLKLPDEDAVIEMMTYLRHELSELGLLPYEISNFAKPGREARHNLGYWNGDDYLGVGAGAHSYGRSIGQWGRRWSNLADPKTYEAAIATSGSAESWHELLTAQSAWFEYFFLGLRRSGGVSLREFELRFGQSADSLYGVPIQVLTQAKLLRRSGDRVSLSETGVLMADSVLENFAEPAIVGGAPRAARPGRHPLLNRLE